MDSPESNRSSIGRGADWVERTTSRRGFLARAGVVLLGAGAGVIRFASAAQAIPSCCGGVDCGNCPGASPCTSTNLKCPAGYSAGSVTSCCNGSHVAFCRSCIKALDSCRCGCQSAIAC